MELTSDQIETYRNHEEYTAGAIRAGRGNVSNFIEFVFKDKYGNYFRQSLMHTIMQEFIDDGLRMGKRRFAIEAHMESGKTQQLSIGRAAYVIGKYAPNVRVGIVCAKDTEAVGRVSAIKRTIEYNERFQLVYPDVKKSDKWQENYFRIAGMSDSMTDPTLRAGSVGSSVMGSRFDWLFLDDPCDPNNSLLSRVEREKTILLIENNWLSRLESEHGIAVWVYTPWHEKDASRIITHREGWHRLSMPVRQDLKGVDVFINGEFQTTIPFWERRNEKVMEMLRANGEALFNRGWHLIPYSLEEATFKHIEPCIRWDHDPRFDSYVSGVGGLDFSTKKRAGTVLTTLGIRKGDKKIVPLDVRIIADPIDVEKHLMDVKSMYPFLRFVNVEDNAIQGALIDRIVAHNIIPIQPFTTGGNKWSAETGLLALDVQFNNRSWEFCIPHKEPFDNCPYCRLVRSFQLFPDGETDPVMSAWFAREGLRTSGMKVHNVTGARMESVNISVGF